LTGPQVWPTLSFPTESRPAVSPRSFLLSNALNEYVLAHSEAPDAVQRALIEETAALPMGGMQISPDVGVLLTVLTRLTGARLAVEVGTFTGYSSIAIARGLAPGGRLVCFDVSEEYTAVARRYWAEAKLDDRIELRIGPAIDGLRALPADAGIDLAFVDADKVGYTDYLAELVPRVRPGGLIIADNALQGGQVVDGGDGNPSVEAIRGFNRAAVGDPRVDAVLLTLGDGLMLLQKRPEA
jgi:caffeoyl-CoA O-methyltransferase